MIKIDLNELFDYITDNYLDDSELIIEDDKVYIKTPFNNHTPPLKEQQTHLKDLMVI